MKNNSCRIGGSFTDMNQQDFYDGKLFDAYRYMGAHKDGDKIDFLPFLCVFFIITSDYILLTFLVSFLFDFF